MQRIVILTVAAFWIALIGSARSQIGDPADDSDAARKERAARLEVMRRRAMSLLVEVEAADGFVRSELVETPILRYSTPQRLELDQTLWAWGRVGRPVAIATIGPDGCEIVSVADGPVSMAARSGWKWNPPSSGMTWAPVPDAPVVGKSALERTRQMKEIARRFTANASSKVNFVELRLMDRPLHRYANPEHGLIDGAIFSFAGGTNPEVLLLLECRQARAEEPVWHYGCARMSAATCEARLGDTVVWTRPGVAQWNAADPYFSRRFGDEDTVTE